jgi:hypothetical protein
VAEEPVPEAPAPAEVPDWLRDMAPEEPGPSAAEEAAAPAAEFEPAAQGPVTEEPAPEMPAPADIPEWLQQAAPSSAPPFVGEIPVSEAEAPEWLSEPRQEVAPSTSADITPPFEVEPDVASAEAAGLARAEIPAWLEAMRPSAERAEETVEEEPAETEGLLEGLRGVLNPLPMIDMARSAESAPPTEISEATLARAQLLQSLLTRPTEAPKPKTRKRTADISELVPRLLIAIALVLVVGGLLLVPQYPTLDSQIPSLAQPDISSVDGVYNLIEGINERESVLVAFEYGPADADEMNAVATVILEHLTAQGVNISIASTRPEGLAVAQALRGDINAREQVASGQRAALEYNEEGPGYRPGNAAGIAQILASIDTPPDLIVLLVAKPEPLRWWVEQTRAYYGADSPPIAAGVSAAIEIATSPYLDINANQLQGIVSGLGGAVAYEARQDTAQTARQLDALLAGHVLIVISMLAGAAFYIVNKPRRREG